jgi:HEAT repeat protein
MEWRRPPGYRPGRMRRRSGLAVLALLAVAPALAQAQDGSWGERFAAAPDDDARLVVLAALGPGDVPGHFRDLAAALASRNVGRPVRIQIALRIAAAGGPDAFDVLAAEIRSGTAAEVRRAALRALPDTGDPRVMAFALGALDDPNLRLSAASVLAELGDQRAVPALRSRLERFAARPGLVGSFGEALARLDPEEASAVLLPLYARGATDDTVDEVARALGACGRLAPVRARLRADFDAEDRELRRRALTALVACGGLESVSFLLGRLETRPESRVDIVRALGALGHEFAVDPLCRQARTGSDAVRLAAVEAVARIEHPIARQSLVQIAASSGDSLAASAALLALARRPDEAARAAIVARLADEREVAWPESTESGQPTVVPARVCDAAYAAGLALSGDDLRRLSGRVGRADRELLRLRLSP